MSLRNSYRLIAPFYDFVAGPLFAGARRASLARLPLDASAEVLIDGVGTGLDLPYLPTLHRYTALDITRAMLVRAVRRGTDANVVWVEGDSQRLPFRDGAFDYVVLHLILAVVPDGAEALREAARVVKPGGRLLVFDKFLPRGRHAPLRRMLSPIAGRIATRTDVVLEDLLDAVPGINVTENRAAVAGGWFRYVTLQRTR
ncbi:MAG TPA: class I SAM-dependent methyltransferase [Burkholderiales bacterium]|nr:class I SAM-dependent methyltransferase [Burkholderiales bacterium]